MKLRGWWIILTFFMLFLAFSQTSREPVGSVTFPLNRVFILRAGSSQLQMVHFNMDVFVGDKIETKKESRCEITLKNGDVVRIDENSIYTIENVEITEKTNRAESFLGLGKLWANVVKIFSKSDYFRVKSPSAVIAVRGTIYRVDANPDSTTQVRVYEGQVQVTPWRPGMGFRGQTPQRGFKPQEVPGPTQVKGPTQVSVETWMEIVKAQQRIFIRPDGTYQKATFDPQEDARLEWVQWNRRRDALLRR